MRFQRRGRSLVVQTPAKLNLFLEILGKRPDGFHELETLMVTVGLYDTLSFTEEASREIRLACRDEGRRRRQHGGSSEIPIPEVPTGADNLVLQAANLLSDHAGVKRGVRIELTKRIPAAAGLAGGSSDAAATLAGLNRLWKLNLSVNELSQLASQLGSDIAFFFCPASAAVCRGRGERVEPLYTPLGMHFVIARPQSGLSTAKVFGQYRPGKEIRAVDQLAEHLQQGRIASAADQLHNALRSPAEKLNPEMKTLRRRFQNLPVLGHEMSGSGTAYYGICHSRGQAFALAKRLRATSDCRAFAVSTCP
jgi:4-diphosphocytidyl-2-C-methyl-D-erythritol kinase